jgi:hypothetical protein
MAEEKKEENWERLIKNNAVEMTNFMINYIFNAVIGGDKFVEYDKQEHCCQWRQKSDVYDAIYEDKGVLKVEIKNPDMTYDIPQAGTIPAWGGPDLKDEANRDDGIDLKSEKKTYEVFTNKVMETNTKAFGIEPLVGKVFVPPPSLTKADMNVLIMSFPHLTQAQKDAAAAARKAAAQKRNDDIIAKGMAYKRKGGNRKRRRSRKRKSRKTRRKRRKSRRKSRRRKRRTKRRR